MKKVNRGLFINSHKREWVKNDSDIWVTDEEKGTLIFRAPCDFDNPIEIANEGYYGLVVMRKRHKVIWILNGNPEEIMNDNIPVLNSDEILHNVLICSGKYPYTGKCITIPEKKYNKLISFFKLGDIIEIHKVGKK